MVLTNGGTEILIAKPSPKIGAVQQSQAYLAMASKIIPPSIDDLVLNSTDDAVISTSLVFWESNLTKLLKRDQREPTRLPFGTRCHFCFKTKNWWQAKDFFFIHRQNHL